jgi:chemotaxis response regulator CheB
MDSGEQTEVYASNGEKKVMSFPIVGIGASAGGLESFSEFLARVPGRYGHGIRVRATSPSGTCQPFSGNSLQEGGISGRNKLGRARKSFLIACM